MATLSRGTEMMYPPFSSFVYRLNSTDSSGAGAAGPPVREGGGGAPALPWGTGAGGVRGRASGGPRGRSPREEGQSSRNLHSDVAETNTSAATVTRTARTATRYGRKSYTNA